VEIVLDGANGCFEVFLLRAVIAEGGEEHVGKDIGERGEDSRDTEESDEEELFEDEPALILVLRDTSDPAQRRIDEHCVGFD